MNDNKGIIVAIWAQWLGWQVVLVNAFLNFSGFDGIQRMCWLSITRPTCTPKLYVTWWVDMVLPSLYPLPSLSTPLLSPPPTPSHLRMLKREILEIFHVNHTTIIITSHWNSTRDWANSSKEDQVHRQGTRAYFNRQTKRETPCNALMKKF